MSDNEIDELTERLRRFADERDWEKFHSPKNLAMALSVEVAEIVEHFQWITEEDSRKLPAPDREKVELELADALIYLTRLADQLGVDLMDVTNKKMTINESKYPAERVRGSAKKYSDYE